jgi:dethiobiotin synthetase
LSEPFRLFVTATDTGVGKTEASCALLSMLADQGLSPAPFKPYETGCRDLNAPSDACALREAAQSGDALELICPHRFRLPLAPAVAAARIGSAPTLRKTLAAYRTFKGRPLVAEGAGGLFVPIDRRRDMIDLIQLLGLPVLLVARAGLGTLNHTALSLQALAARGIPVGAVLLTCTSAKHDLSERDNAAWIQRRASVRVLGPVPFRRERNARRSAFRSALKPLLQERSSYKRGF